MLARPAAIAFPSPATARHRAAPAVAPAYPSAAASVQSPPPGSATTTSPATTRNASHPNRLPAPVSHRSAAKTATTHTHTSTTAAAATPAVQKTARVATRLFLVQEPLLPAPRSRQ